MKARTENIIIGVSLTIMGILATLSILCAIMTSHKPEPTFCGRDGTCHYLVKK